VRSASGGKNERNSDLHYKAFLTVVGDQKVPSGKRNRGYAEKGNRVRDSMYAESAGKPTLIKCGSRRGEKEGE